MAKRHTARCACGAVKFEFNTDPASVASKTQALETLAKHLSMFKDQVDLNVNMSLADLVNGSYELEKRLRAEGKLIDVAPVKTPDDSP